MMNEILWLVAAVAILVIPATGQAAVVTYTASDASTVPGGVFTNSTAEAAVFDAAASRPLTIVTFELANIGQAANLAIWPFVSIDGLNAGGSPQEIRNQPACGNECGFNTTSGGANYLELKGGSITFSFDDAHSISTFGAFFTGVQLDRDSISFNDGSPHKLFLPNPLSGVEFFGFTDIGAKITSITVKTQHPSGGDIIGIDDVRFDEGGAGSSVPEPASMALLAFGLTGLGVIRRRSDA